MTLENTSTTYPYQDLIKLPDEDKASQTNFIRDVKIK